MLLVSRKEQESPEALIRRFNKMVQRDGVLQEVAATTPVHQQSREAAPGRAPSGAAAPPRDGQDAPPAHESLSRTLS